MVVTVSDNGIGISAENLESVFMKYRRVNSSIEGNGLGLYLVKNILEISGGKITVESELNKGSIFRIFLPVN